MYTNRLDDAIKENALVKITPKDFALMIDFQDYERISEALDEIEIGRGDIKFKFGSQELIVRSMRGNGWCVIDSRTTIRATAPFCENVCVIYGAQSPVQVKNFTNDTLREKSQEITQNFQMPFGSFVEYVMTAQKDESCGFRIFSKLSPMDSNNLN